MAFVPSAGAPLPLSSWSVMRTGYSVLKGPEASTSDSAIRMPLLNCYIRCGRKGFGLTAGMGVRKMKELFISRGWGDAAFLNDIAMENKGLEYSQYLSKESLAQQGGYAMTNKGPTSTTRPG
jgi:hypothetical protein